MKAETLISETLKLMPNNQLLNEEMERYKSQEPVRVIELPTVNLFNVDEGVFSPYSTTVKGPDNIEYNNDLVYVSKVGDDSTYEVGCDYLYSYKIIDTSSIKYTKVTGTCFLEYGKSFLRPIRVFFYSVDYDEKTKKISSGAFYSIALDEQNNHCDFDLTLPQGGYFILKVEACDCDYRNAERGDCNKGENLDGVYFSELYLWK